MIIYSATAMDSSRTLYLSNLFLLISSIPILVSLLKGAQVYKCSFILKNCGTRLELTNHGVRRTLNKIFYSFFHIVIFKMILHYNTCDG